jgi:hypothetical protein
MIKDGIYVGHSGVEKSPKNAIATIETGSIEPPHRDGSLQTTVAHATSGASINIKIVQIMVRFIKSLAKEIREIQEKHTKDINFLHPLQFSRRQSVIWDKSTCRVTGHMRSQPQPHFDFDDSPLARRDQSDFLPASASPQLLHTRLQSRPLCNCHRGTTTVPRLHRAFPFRRMQCLWPRSSHQLNR